MAAAASAITMNRRKKQQVQTNSAYTFNTITDKQEPDDENNSPRTRTRTKKDPFEIGMVEKQIKMVRDLHSNVYVGGSPGIRHLLAQPQELALQHFQAIISDFQLVSALIMSGLLGVVCSPVIVSDLPKEKQVFGHAFNLTASALTLWTIISCATLCWANQAAGGQSGHTIGMALAKSVRGFHYSVELPQFMQVMLVEMLIVLAAFTYQPMWAGYVTLGLWGLIHFGQMFIFFSWSAYAFPTQFIPWVRSVGMCCLAPRTRRQKDMVNIVKSITVEAMQNNHGIRPAHGFASTVEAMQKQKNPGIETKEPEQVLLVNESQELDAMIALALPTINTFRKEKIVKAMMEEKMTVSTLKIAANAELGGGGALLCSLLGELSTELKIGERLVILSFVAEKKKNPLL
jgi:hypothetical protein